jgi:hypothetical protein
MLTSYDASAPTNYPKTQILRLMLTPLLKPASADGTFDVVVLEKEKVIAKIRGDTGSEDEVFGSGGLRCRILFLYFPRARRILSPPISNIIIGVADFRPVLPPTHTNMDDPMDKDFDAPQSNSAVPPITDDGMGQSVPELEFHHRPDRYGCSAPYLRSGHDRHRRRRHF